ncbi:hypothetical protein HWV62_41280 [Athelia sp. TMB]|nr:hypothetical protein HWV62_41280 [Athelia sp. TMB]
MPSPKNINIVDVLHHDVYPRIETRNGGALSKASEGKTLLITGASKGIGRSIALLHAHTHPRSIIITARTASSLDLVATEIAAIDPKIRIIKASVDVDDATAVSAFFKDLREVEKVGRIDVLFNNAGYLEQDLSTWTSTINTNIIGVANFTHEFLRHNFAAVGGSPDGTTEGKNKQALKDVSVIVTSSAGALVSFPGFSAYQPTSKFFPACNYSSGADYRTL